MTNTEALWAAITELRLSADEIMAHTFDDNMAAEEMYAAAAQLERMVPRVLDESEISMYKGAFWVEKRNEENYDQCSAVLSDMDKYFYVIVRRSCDSKNVEVYSRDEYGKTWRLWTAMPDECDMKRAEWQEENG